MNSKVVTQVLDWLEQAGVAVCMDGGWAVDALLGEQTRSHADLDLALDRESLLRAREALEVHGFRHDATSEPGLPARLVMLDEGGRQVDFHPLFFDERGDGWQQLSSSGKAWGRYPAEDMKATGTISGRQVRCLSPDLQFRFRMGYEWTTRDEHDLRLLIDHFRLPSPPALQNG
jgi:lincosamide nucleotidyltransferase A/C/D/E